MTQLLPSCIAISAALFSSLTLADGNNATYQSFQLGITQQSQLFEFNDTDNADTRLNVWGKRAQYQVGKGPWNLIMDYHEADASDSDGNNQQGYQLDFKTQSAGIFVEYALENIWLAIGYADSEDTTEYRVNSVEETSNNNQSKLFLDDSQVNYQNFILEGSYVHYTDAGQFTATWGLTKQLVEEEIQYREFNKNTGQLSLQETTDYQIDEDGVLTNLTLSYGRLFALGEAFKLALKAGVRREITLSGDGRIQQTSRGQGGPNNNQTPNADELQSTSLSASTSHQAQLSLLHPSGSISLSVDKLSDQTFAHSYFSAALSVYF